MADGMWTNERALIEALISLARDRAAHSHGFLLAWRDTAFGVNDERLTAPQALASLDWLKERLERPANPPATMANNTEPQQPLSDARLAAIRARVEGADDPTLFWNGMSGALEQAEEDRAALLIENERLQAETQNYRAELKNLIAAADATHVETQPYAGVGHTKIVGPFPAALAHARRLLADQPESEAKTHDSK